MLCQETGRTLWTLLVIFLWSLSLIHLLGQILCQITASLLLQFLQLQPVCNIYCFSSTQAHQNVLSSDHCHVRLHLEWICEPLGFPTFCLTTCFQMNNKGSESMIKSRSLLRTFFKLNSVEKHFQAGDSLD